MGWVFEYEYRGKRWHKALRRNYQSAWNHVYCERASVFWHLGSVKPISEARTIKKIQVLSSDKQIEGSACCHRQGASSDRFGGDCARAPYTDAMCTGTVVPRLKMDRAAASDGDALIPSSSRWELKTNLENVMGRSHAHLANSSITAYTDCTCDR
jgi:hypothetical protein